MKLLAALLIVSFAGALLAFSSEEDREIQVKWEQYKNEHDKDYHHTEEEKRRVNFVSCDQKIKVHNSGNHGWKMAHNSLSDKSDDEKRSLLGARKPHNHTHPQNRSLESFDRELMELLSLDRQSSVDYRTDKCIGSIKNQRSCGSCWAFSAMHSLEFSYCKKYGTYVSLGEQQLVDCDAKNHGCNGGWMMTAWSYLSSAGGADPTSAYPYTAKGGSCKFLASKVVSKVGSSGYLPTKNVAAMEAAVVKYGSIAVAIEVIDSFYSYSSGIYSDPKCPTNGSVNHAVNVVGYGPGYWIVRNSWGTGWGSRGYILMKKGVNMCSIETYPMYVVATK